MLTLSCRNVDCILALSQVGLTTSTVYNTVITNIPRPSADRDHKFTRNSSYPRYSATWSKKPNSTTSWGLVVQACTTPPTDHILFYDLLGVSRCHRGRTKVRLQEGSTQAPPWYFNLKFLHATNLISGLNRQKCTQPGCRREIQGPVSCLRSPSRCSKTSNLRSVWRRGIRTRRRRWRNGS